MIVVKTFDNFFSATTPLKKVDDKIFVFFQIERLFEHDERLVCKDAICENVNLKN